MLQIINVELTMDFFAVGMMQKHGREEILLSK